MSGHTEVSMRERVKLPPSKAMIESYWQPNIELAYEYHFALDTWIHLAHALMLHRRQIIGTQDARKITDALVRLDAQGPEALKVDGSLEDLYSYTERYLTQALGPEVGGRLHTGRSRNDLGVTTWRMALRGQMLEVLRALRTMRRATLDMAAAQAGTVMPGYTHWQHAQPITLGYYLLGFADVLERDFSRCAAAYRRTNCSPLGAGALAATSFPLDRAYTAAALGFEGLVEVAYDAVSSRDDAHEAAAAMAIMMTNLSRLAVDLQAWSTMEYRFLELGDQHSSVSSIMPQKKNPACLEHIKAEAGYVTGHLMAALSCTKNTSYADVSDGVTGPSDSSLDAAVKTQRVLRLFAEVLQAITVFPDRMAHFAEIGFGTATELADVIVRETGISFRMAHNVVATVVSEAIEAGHTANQIASEDLDKAARTLFGRDLGLSADTVRAALDPAQNISRRTVTGGPALQNMRTMLAEREANFDRDSEEIDTMGKRLRHARDKVFADAAAELG